MCIMRKKIQTVSTKLYVLKKNCNDRHLIPFEIFFFYFDRYIKINNIFGNKKYCNRMYDIDVISTQS